MTELIGKMENSIELLGFLKERARKSEFHDYFFDITEWLFFCVFVFQDLEKIKISMNRSLRNSKPDKEKINYELDNFYLRLSIFHQRIVQLVNSVYLRLSHSNTGIRREIRKNQKTKEINIFLEEFEDKNKKYLDIRNLITHQKYEHFPVEINEELESKNFNEDFPKKVSDIDKSLISAFDLLEEVSLKIKKDLDSNFDKTIRIF